ncbi:hypothetical protein [Alishewanella longhuensis]|uniref:hypothetical protein n=1 Tax=Alishewanella longhuensis TaxID=1091037 RepID=UPI001E31744F|nr:hypothetical protein [Alishewanella longhuensis]
MAAKATDMLGAMRSFSDYMVEKLIQLIVVYSLKTLLFPLLLMYLLWQLGSWFVSLLFPTYPIHQAKLNLARQ